MADDDTPIQAPIESAAESERSVAPDPAEVRQALMRIRVMWLALIMGQLAFALIVAFVVMSRDSIREIGVPVDILFYVSLATIVPAVLVGYFARNQIYKRHWVGDVISPRGYMGGNLVLLVICAAVSFFGLFVCVVGQSLWPYSIPSVAALAVQMINFPHGRPMQPPTDGFPA